MSNTVVGFTISVDGISSINELNQEIKQTKAAMNALNLTTEEGQKEYAELAQTLGKLTSEQKVLRKQQDDLNKSFMDANKNLGAYDKASAELNKLRKEFKNAAFDGSKTSKEMAELKGRIQELDQSLKKADGQVGQFQRNVGNYPMTFRKVNRALMQSIPGFEMFSGVLRDGEGKISGFGKALIGGFLIFQGAKQIMRAIASLDEFNKKINETRDTVSKFSGAFGDDLESITANTSALAETFNTDSNSIAGAAKSLSKQMGISFEEAMTQIEGALVEGRGNATEFLKTVEEFPDTFQEADKAAGDFGDTNKRLLEANKRLAESQIAIQKDTQRMSDEFKIVGATIKNTLIVFFVKLWDLSKPLISAFRGLFAALWDLGKAVLGVFTGGSKTVDMMQVFTSVVNTILAPIKVVVLALTGLVNILKIFSPILSAVIIMMGAYKAVMIASNIITKIQTFAMGAYTLAMKLYTQFTDGAKKATQGFNLAMKASPIGLIIGAATAAAAAFTTMAGSTDKEIEALEKLAEAEKKAAEEAEKLSDVYRQRVQDREAAYQQEKANLELQYAQGTMAEEAYQNQLTTINKKRITDLQKINNDQLALLRGRVAAGEKITDGEMQQIKASNQALLVEEKQIQAEEAKLKREKIKKAQDAQKKLVADRKKFREDEIKEERGRVALLADLNQRYLDEQIQNIKDSQQRQIAEIENNFMQQKESMKKQYDELVISQQERLDQLIKTFVESREGFFDQTEAIQNAQIEQFKKTNDLYLELAKKNAELLAEVQKLQAKTREELEIQTEDRIKQVREDAANEELEKAIENAEELRSLRDKLLNDRLDSVDAELEMIELKSQEALNNRLKNERDIRKRDEIQRLADEQALVDKINAIKEKGLKLDAQEARLKREAKMGIEIKQEEFDTIAKERQKLNTELSGLQLQQADNAAAEADKTKGAWKKTFTDVLEYTQKGFELISQVMTVVAERQQAQFDKDIERSQERQSRLQEEIDNSSGLRRRYFEQQLELEVSTAQSIEKAKEEARKKAAKQQKAIAIMQSIIQTALAVTAALSGGGNALKIASGVNVIEAIAAGVTGAIQTAVIAAQPLAKGGVVGKGNEIAELIPNFDSGGRVTNRGNIKPLSNGDNVLATLKTGEVVLNQQQQQRIGYSALKKANIPNFAVGGVVGAPSTLITANNKSVADGKIQMDILQRMAEETSNRIDRIQVVYTAATDDDVTKGRTERKTIQTIAQF